MKIANIEANVIDHMGSDLSVVNAARVSFHKESKWESNGQNFKRLTEGDIKLINYLAKHKHVSPFNHAFLSARVKAPIFVARQLVKHKFMPWNEVSRRYVDEEPEFYFPEFWRERAGNLKQGSLETQHPKNEHIDLGWKMECHYLKERYGTMIQEGVAPEQARMILPQNTMTEWIWSGTLGAFADMLHLRLDPHTQAESRIVAQQLHEQILKLFPVSLKALLENK